MGDNVLIISRRMVRPEPTPPTPTPTETETIHLTPWDLTVIAVEYIQKGVLLPMPMMGGTTGGSGGGEQLVESLASSLARALGRFYPFAGRLAVDVVADRQLTTISLRCTGEGVELVHAVAPGITVADITDPLYVPRQVRSFFPLDGVPGVNAGPVLAAQVTELADGVFVAMSLNHGVADGTTFWHLFNTWSEISRRRWSGRDDVEMISTPPPVLDRWFLDSCPVPIPLPLGKLEKCISMVVQRAEAPVQECVFHFPAESVRKLKARANAEVAASESETAMTVSISSLQAVLAHLWRAACRARGLLANEQETAYAFAVGCRGRVAGVPATYSGNALSSAVARAAAREILDQDHGLGRAAWLLNRGVASVDETSEREKLASWAHSPMFACPQAFVGTGSLLMGSSPRFNVYGNDFGWGAPVAVRSGSASKVDGMTTVYEDGGGPGGMALEVCLTPEALARLVADDEFMSATTPHTARLI